MAGRSAHNRPTKPKHFRKPKAAPKGVDAAALYEAAQDALSIDDFDSARLYLRQAVQLAPQSLEMLEALGALLAEAGPADEAVATLQRAVALQPDAGHEKYMYLGQLLEGREALASLQKGVQLLQGVADAEARPHENCARGEAGAGEARAQLAGALCAMAELHLAQAGGAAAAAGECERALERARRAAPGSPEPLQVLASLRVEQGRPDEALAALRASLALWCPRLGGGGGSAADARMSDARPDLGAGGSVAEGDPAAPGEGCLDGAAQTRAGMAGGARSEVHSMGREQADGGSRAGAGQSAAGEAAGGRMGGQGQADCDGAGGEDEADDGSEGGWEEASEGGGGDELPSYEFRFEAAKLLLELDDRTDAAADVLEGLLAEDDSVPDVWYLAGLCAHAGGDFEAALDAAAAGERLLRGGGGGGAERGKPGEEAAPDSLAADFAELRAAIEESMANTRAGGGPN